MTEEKKPSTDFISSYSKAQQKMIATSDNTYGTLGTSRARYLEQIRDYRKLKELSLLVHWLSNKHYLVISFIKTVTINRS